MNNPLFPILGDGPIPLIGRKKRLVEICDGLTQQSPSCYSLIGPPLSGKSVLMHRLEEWMSAEENPYAFVIPWNFGHSCPDSQAAFVKEFCKSLAEALRVADEDYEDYVAYLGDYEQADLKEVTDGLDKAGAPILMLWDSFDVPLARGLPQSLWDFMRELVHGKKHQIVTATRDTLYSLMRDAAPSPFHNIFTVVRLGVFDEDDRSAVFSVPQMSELNFSGGARTELQNWSGGFPPLFLGILGQLDPLSASEVTNQTINEAAAKTGIELADNVLRPLWGHCSSEARELFSNLVNEGERPTGDSPKKAMDELIQKGLAVKAGNKLSSSCRLLEEYAKENDPAVGSMPLLFGTPEHYEQHIRGVLEYRLSHIKNTDSRLYRLVARSIKDIPLHPDDCLESLNGIRAASFDTIWEIEGFVAREIPSEIIEYWDKESLELVKGDTKLWENRYWWLKELKNNQNKVPLQKPAVAIQTLRHLTGAEHFDKQSKCSKSVFLLLDTIYGHRNLSQHPDDEISTGVAVTVMFACIELLAILDSLR